MQVTTSWTIFWQTLFCCLAITPSAVHAREVVLKQCESQLYSSSAAERCGEVDVALDHLGDNSRKLAAPVRMVLSGNPDASTRPPIIWLNGGPGMGNMDSAASSVLSKDFDIVHIGYRGVDFGPDLSCDNIAHAITSSKRLLIDGVTSLQAAIEQCIDAMEADGYSANSITLAQTVHDIDGVLEALNIEQAHFVGGSFGTRIALIYQEVFPERVAKSVLLGANPPGRTIWMPAALDKVLGRIADICTSSTRCSGSSEAMSMALRISDRAVQSGYPLPFDMARARVTAFLLAYDNTVLPMIVDAFEDANKGDATGLHTLAMAHDFALPRAGIVWGHFVLMAATADLDETVDYRVALAQSDGAPFGSPMAQLFWPAIQGLDLPLITPAYRRLKENDIEILLISGALDVSAPYEQVRDEIIPYRQNATHWIIEDAGHYNLYTSDIMREVGHFLTGDIAQQPTVPVPLVLRENIGLSDILKIGVSVIVLVISLFAWTVIRFLKRARHS